MKVYEIDDYHDELVMIMFQAITDEKYEVKRCVEEAAIIVSSESDPKTSCSVTLTSPVMRETQLADGGQSPLPSMVERSRPVVPENSTIVKWFIILF